MGYNRRVKHQSCSGKQHTHGTFNVPKPFSEIQKNRVFAHTLHQDSFKHFSRYNYKAWIPPRVRRNWITQWVAPDEYLDIGCGGYPVTMDIPSGQKRGVGVDISEGAAQSYKKYFKDFYVFDIEHIELQEAPSLLKRFGAVILSERLEHFHDPLLVLHKATAFLRPGGQILITYPNAYSIAQYVDRAIHLGHPHRFREFHASHIYLVRKRTLENLFAQAGLAIHYFDFRPSDIVEGFPREDTIWWKKITSLAPSLLGHQFFYVLSYDHKPPK